MVLVCFVLLCCSYMFGSSLPSESARLWAKSVALPCKCRLLCTGKKKIRRTRLQKLRIRDRCSTNSPPKTTARAKPYGRFVCSLHEPIWELIRAASIRQKFCQLALLQSPYSVTFFSPGFAMAAPTESVVEALPHSTPPRRSREGEALQQYYIAVDRQQYKMETMVDLLLVLGRRASLPVAICCSARDSLDAICARVSASKQFSLLLLHSDQGDSERAEALSNFHAIVRDWNHSTVKSSVAKSEGDGDEQVEPKKSGLLVTTDACLPSAVLGEPSLGARVLIHYDLPTKKEAYLRRMAACLASAPAVVGTSNFGGIAGGIVISMVVGGEVRLLRSIEEGCGVVIDEMPIHISELL